MKKALCFFIIALLAAGGLFATSLNESFLSGAFPPAGWKIINGGNSNTWQQSNAYQHNSSGGAMIWNSNGGANDDWLITPQLTPSTGNASFSFWGRNYGGTLERCNVKLSTTGNNQADFTVTLASNLGPVSWTQYTYNLSAYIGQPVFIAIQAISNNNQNPAVLYIDEVTGPDFTGYEGFETNNFNTYAWNNSSASPWTLQSTDTAFGSYAAKSGAIPDNGSTSLILTQIGLAAGNITFYQKVSSENNGDKLKFYIDDVEKWVWSGEGSWTMESYAVTAGTHTFRWTYSKNASGSSGSDCAWIDQIYLPPIIYGTPTNPFLIYTASQLSSVRTFLGSTHSDKHFKLMNDIDLTSYLAIGGEGYTAWGAAGWMNIGSNSASFYGHFDGNNKTISGLKIDRGANTDMGLFGNVYTGGIIENTNVVTAPGGFVKGWISTGILAGYSNGTITNCSATGSVRGQSNSCGGLVGNASNASSITRCSSRGDVIGAAYNVGGLVGENYGTINNSYSRASVTGQHYLGGLVGHQGSGSITNCYATGQITGSSNGGLLGSIAGGSTVVNSYWDTQTTGLSYSNGSNASFGKTTAQMKTQSTYTGWDYTRETANGTNDYWTMWYSDNEGYPELFWKHSSEQRAPALTSPADMAAAMPVGGFNLSWIPNSAGQAPVSYTLFMVLGDRTKLYDTSFAGQHEFPGLTVTSFNPVTTGGLTFHQDEQWYWTVKAHFAGGGISSPPTVRYFTTVRDPFATESFEVGNLSNNYNILDWTYVSGYGYTPWMANNSQTTYNRSPRTGNWNLTMNYANDSYTHSWLFRPYPMVGGVTYDIELYARQATHNLGWAIMSLHMGTAASEAAMTNELTPAYGVNILDGDYQRVSGSFTPTTSGTYYLGIKTRLADYTYYISMDDVTVRARAVPNPVTLVSPAALALQQALLPTFSWAPNATGGLVTGYKVYCQASSSPITPTTLLATVPAGTYSYTLTTPLNYDATYYWMVVATSTTGDAVGSPVRSFSTIATTLLYEAFSTYPPANWSGYSGVLSDPSTLTASWGWAQKLWANIPSNPVNYAACANIYGESTRWLVTPPLQLGAAPYQLQLDIALTDFNNSNSIPGTTGIDDRFVILIGDGSSWSPANILREWNNTGSPYVYNDIPNTGIHVTIPLDAYTGVKYIAFYGGSTLYNADNDLFVDNVRVYVPPINDLGTTALYGPLTFTVGSPVTHTVSLANYGTAAQTGYTVYLKSVSPAATLATTSISAPLASGASASHNLTWTPSSSGVDMNIYAEVALATDTAPENNITANLLCYPHVAGALVESFESGIPASWTVLNVDGGDDGWMQLDWFPHSGAYGAGVISQYNDDWLITPPLQLSSETTDVLSFWMKSYDVDTPEPWEVLVSTTNTLPASFTLLDSGALASSDFTRVEYNLDAYGNAVIYFAVRSRGINGALICVDDFHGPLIYIPTSLNTPNLSITNTENNVSLNWDAVIGATEYRVYVSDDPYTWLPDFTVVPGGIISYNFDATSVAGKFFKVTAYANRSVSKPITTPPAKQDNSRMEALKAKLKDKRK